MKRIRHHRQHAALNLPTLQLEGGLFLPDQLEKAAQGRAQDQADTDYGIPKGTKLKDEYSRAFQIACAQWQHFAAQMERADLDAAQLTTAFVHELLRDAFGYATMQTAQWQQVGELRYPVSLMAGSLPVLAAPHTLGLDEADAQFAAGGPFDLFIPDHRTTGMAVEDPLGGIIGVGLGETVGVVFLGNFGPVVEVEGDLDQGGVGDFQTLINLPHRLVVLG